MSLLVTIPVGGRRAISEIAVESARLQVGHLRDAMVQTVAWGDYEVDSDFPVRAPGLYGGQCYNLGLRMYVQSQGAYPDWWLLVDDDAVFEHDAVDAMMIVLQATGMWMVALDNTHSHRDGTLWTVNGFWTVRVNPGCVGCVTQLWRRESLPDQRLPVFSEAPRLYDVDVCEWVRGQGGKFGTLLDRRSVMLRESILYPRNRLRTIDMDIADRESRGLEVPGHVMPERQLIVDRMKA